MKTNKSMRFSTAAYSARNHRPNATTLAACSN